MFKTPYNQPLSTTQINMLFQKAKHGDSSAIAELHGRNSAITKRANAALSRLEKTGFKRWAYTRATSFTESEYGTKRFTTAKSKLEDVADVADNLRHASKFLKYKTATVSGQRLVDKEILQAFRDKGITIDKSQEEAFLDFISSDDFEMLKKFHRDSGDFIVDMIEMTTQQNLTVDFNDFANTISKVINNSLSYDKALEDYGVKI